MKIVRSVVGSAAVRPQEAAGEVHTRHVREDVFHHGCALIIIRPFSAMADEPTWPLRQIASSSFQLVPMNETELHAFNVKRHLVVCQLLS